MKKAELLFHLQLPQNMLILLIEHFILNFKFFALISHEMHIKTSAMKTDSINMDT